MLDRLLDRGPKLVQLTVQLFVNGEGTRGGSVHHNIASHPFLGERRTAPRYRFYSVRDEFPGLTLASDGRCGGVTH